MKLTNASICEGCKLVVEPDKHGRCPTCQSEALAWLTRILDGRVQFETPAESYSVASLERIYTL
jgi:rRNA maturation endonuclease Nob1